MRSKMLLAALLLAVPVALPAQALVPAAPVEAGFSTDRLAKLDAHMRRLVADGALPGGTVLVARHGKVVSFGTYGEASRGKPVRRDTIFRIYSQTKAVTGAALMILFEEGKWRLDDPVTKFVPELAAMGVFDGLNPDGGARTVKAARAPTMRELMNHSAGFAYGLGKGDPIDALYYGSGIHQAPTSDDYIARLARLPLAHQPGTRFRYSSAVDVQGVIVERLSGQSLGAFMQARIFGPLKMVDTGFSVPAAKRDRLATLYAFDGAKKALGPPQPGPLIWDAAKPPYAPSGGAGLVSTTMDYARFAQMILNRGELDGARILAPATVKLMTANSLSDAIMATPGNYTNANGRGFALDLEVVMDPAKAGTLQGKGTVLWGGAAGSWYWIDPENDVIVLGMMQVMGRGGDPRLAAIDHQVGALVYQALTEPGK